ncbi:hypothetical protein [Novimethylophilus kurashikiensis]|uniref:hypothetical protein n=1 Tax=Novimethylophilus kurashikiensis TaxID=1825523 RepID=UPI000D590A84|nr:hypothetical protein [Novimethylophilus kurashikiensis]
MITENRYIESIVSINPDELKIREICGLSSQNAAKWIKCAKTGNMYFFPSDKAYHADVAFALHIEEYTKGIEKP